MVLVQKWDRLDYFDGVQGVAQAMRVTIVAVCEGGGALPQHHRPGPRRAEQLPGLRPRD